MNITVRMITAQALAQMRAMNAGLAGNTAGFNRASAAATGYGAALARVNLIRWGSQMQWVGRQMQTNFTLPIMLATGMAVKWALENEKAMVRVSKVYGDGRLAANVMKNEVKALEGAMAALSSKFGVAQKDAINIAGDWAAAGASGIALAKATELTMKTMVLGEIEAKKATEALIAIQAQWGFNTQQLIGTIEQLNVIENETGITLGGLIEGFARASGVARSAGLSTLHLGAALAALTPAAGTAAQAGNALKTIISRLLSPTQEATQVLREMGIETAEMGWKSATADQRLQILSTSFGKLSQAQKGVVSAVVASRYQINKFEVLMDALSNTNSYYYRAVEQASNATKNHAQAEKELAAVLASSPRRLQVMWHMFRNAAATVGEQLVPTVLMLAAALSSVMRWFNQLDPSMRKFLIGAALMLAVLGPLIRYVASLAQAIGILKLVAMAAGTQLVAFGKMMMTIMLFPFTAVIGLFGKMYAAIIALTVSFGAKMRAAMTAVTVAMTGPWGIAAAAIIGIIVVFYNDIKALVTSIVGYFRSGLEGIGSSTSGLVRMFWSAVDGIRRAFFALPEGVQKALIAVVNMVRSAAMAVYDLFSYLNPFAKHSPSLVDNVTLGMQEIGRQFGSVVPVVEGHLKQAYAAIKAFGIATRTMVDGVNMADLGNKRVEVGKVSPGALGMFDALVSSLKVLKVDLSAVQSQMERQQQVVDGWKVSLDAANMALDKQDFLLQQLKNTASGIGDQLDDAKAALQRFTDAPIKGQQAMSDAIFANQMASKRLRLEMMNIEDVVGPIDKLESRLQGLNGAMELVTGQREELRSAGAGSEILGQYDAQIAALENQKQAVDEAMAPLRNLQNEIDELGRTAERLDLEESLQFDPLRRQIDQLANSMRELPFSEILAGVTANKAKVEELQAAYDAANAAVKTQELVVNQLKAARDVIQQSYDAEAAKLDVIKQQYDKVKTAVGDVEAALDSAAQAAQDFQRAARGGSDEFITPGLQNFRDAAGGDFPTEGGGFSVGREGGFGDQSKMIEDFTKQLQEDLDKSIKSLSPFEWIKDKWNDLKGWWEGTARPWLGGLFSGISLDTGKFDGVIKWFKDLWATLDDFFSGLSRMFGPVLEDYKSAWADIWQQIEQDIWPALQDLGKAFGDLWKAVQPIVGPLITGLKYLVGFIITVFVAGIKASLTILIHVWNGLMGGILTAVKGIIQVITGLVQFVVGVFTGDWKKAWEGIKNIFVGLWNTIYGLLKGVLGGIYGFFKGWIESIVDWFKWLYDEIVGHSIIPDLVRDVVAWFKSLPGKVIAAIMGLINMVLTWAKNVWTTITNTMKTGWNAVWTWLKTIPLSAYNALLGLVGLVGTLARNAWNGFTSSARSILDGFISWLTSIPKRAAAALASIGTVVIGAVKSAYNAGAGFLNTSVIGNVNKVTGVFGVKLPNLPRFAKGGIVPGGYSSVDNQLIMARSGEGILIPEAVRDIGGPAAIDALNRSAGGSGGVRGQLKNNLEHFKDGGVVGWFKSNVVDRVSGWIAKGSGYALENLLRPAASAVKSVMPNGFTKDLMVGLINKWATSAKSWGAAKDKSSGGGQVSLGGPSGNSIAAILAVAKRFYAGARVSSGYRPGDPGHHGAGRAADLVGGGAAGMVRMAQGFHGMSGRLLELLHSGGGGYWAKNGKRVGASYYGPANVADHWDHVHVAANANALGFDKGGPLPTGFSMAYNGTGETEWISTADEVVRITRGLNAGMNAARGFNAMGSLLSRVDARMARMEERMTSSKAGGTTININGDLVLPNIRTGGDAEEFVKNLEALARKSS